MHHVVSLFFVHSGRLRVTEMKRFGLTVVKRHLGLINNTSKTSTEELIPLIQLLHYSCSLQARRVEVLLSSLEAVNTTRREIQIASVKWAPEILIDFNQ